jgi:hypothetical protein
MFDILIRTSTSRENANLYLFFRTIENLLQALFHGAVAAKSGLLSTEKNTAAGTASKVVDQYQHQSYHCISPIKSEGLIHLISS